MFSAVSVYAGMIRGAVYGSKEAANANDCTGDLGVLAAGESAVTKVFMNWTASWSAIKLMLFVSMAMMGQGWLFEERTGDVLLLPGPILCRLAGESVELSSPVIFGTIVNMLALLPATLALRQTSPHRNSA